MEDRFIADEGDEYLTRVVIDIMSRTFRMYSNEGTLREIECDTIDEFTDIHNFIKEFIEMGMIEPETVAYAEPTVKV